MSETLRVGDCFLVRGTDKCYIECIKKDNYFTLLFIFCRNKEILPQNQCCQVPIVEGTISRSGHMHNISSATNQHNLIRISSKTTQAEEEDPGRGEGW